MKTRTASLVSPVPAVGEKLMSSSRGELLPGCKVTLPTGGLAREKGPPTISSPVTGSMNLMAPILKTVPPVFVMVTVLSSVVFT
jgi:hypothetical protein